MIAARSFRLAALLAAGLALPLLAATFASATVQHQITLVFDDDFDPSNGEVEERGDFIRVDRPDLVDRSLVAAIGGPGYAASGSVGEFGALGVSGSHFRGGSLSAQVDIRDDAIRNPFGVPVNAVANFIVDGGRLALTAASSDPADPAFLELVLTVTSRVTGSSRRVFQSIITLESTNFMTPTLTQRGSSLGAFAIPNTDIVEIPFSFQSLDIGVIPAGGSVEIDYQLIIESQAEIAEGVFFEFSDPLDVTGARPFSVEFLPLVAPEPRLGALLLAGLGALAGLSQGAGSGRPNR